MVTARARENVELAKARILKVSASVIDNKKEEIGS